MVGRLTDWLVCLHNRLWSRVCVRKFVEQNTQLFKWTAFIYITSSIRCGSYIFMCFGFKTMKKILMNEMHKIIKSLETYLPLDMHVICEGI